jgi:DNA-directed RNA polymerase specialized sigma24 family protein
VGRLERVVWKSVNMMTYDHEVRDDAFAATWLRLAERLESIREPEKLSGWLATTACNEVRQICDNADVMTFPSVSRSQGCQGSGN